MNILFIVNGNCENIPNILPKDYFLSFDKIICVDGGLNNLYKINKNYIPHYIFGDFDSIDQKILDNYKSNFTKIILKDNQDESDLFFSLKYILDKYKQNINKIIILCGTGDRFDHTLCTLLTLKYIPNKIKCKIIGDNEEIYLLKDKLEIENKKGKTLSIIPLTNVKEICCNDLKWPLNKIDLDFGFVGGISNIIEKDKITITLKNGLAVIIINRYL